MNLRRIYIILIIQITELLFCIRSDHVQLLNCSEDPECLKKLDEHLLDIIRENSVNTTEPCEHFWDFACGSWTSAPYYDHVDNFGAMANYYADQLIAIINKFHKEKSPAELKNLLKLLRKYFLSCKSTGNYYLEMSPYLKELEVTEIFGDKFKWTQDLWHNDELWQDFNWLKAVAYLRNMVLKIFF